jgi:PTS system arbutin-like IIC component
VLAATLAAVSYTFGVVGNFGGGLIEWMAQNWMPLFRYHSTTYLTQIIIGLIFTAIYFFAFRFVILKFDLATPGRERDTDETKLYTKADYKAKNSSSSVSVVVDKTLSQAQTFLEALGGAGNIVDVTNCATRLRVSVKDGAKLMSDACFKEAGAHGVVRNGNAIQVIVGLSVPQVRDEFESLISQNNANGMA